MKIVSRSIQMDRSRCHNPLFLISVEWSVRTWKIWFDAEMKDVCVVNATNSTIKPNTRPDYIADDRIGNSY